MYTKDRGSVRTDEKVTN